ncbi:lipopolysaccharide biosynthesis protein [Symmachiella dynata]|uniref:Polysaccharide biosynthesis protein n=1 Tax=Symmachiella dynata TaxID=2527995 RepID=A0A517ZHG6_9PLAN|nr:oligosaccharide flippase family protein [Symmachiella dynata]QDT46417.1 Polysaccharide biosynthesis protein [Symmachiella dynata]QDU41918.1 Polysaccharide biosynthesis protein [Symmachiella dynata]
MSDKALAVRGVVFNWLGRGCAIIITFFLTPYLVSKLGDESYGLWSMVMAFTSYYAMADMGLRGAGVKYIAQYLAVKDYESVNKVFVTSLAVYALIGAVILVIVGIASVILPYTIDLGNHSIREMQWVIFLTGATMATRMLSQVYGAALSAMQRHDITNIVAVAMQLFQAVAVVAALLGGYGLWGMAVATFTVTLTGQLLRTAFSYWLLPELSISTQYFDKQMLKQVFRFSGVNVMANTAARLLVYGGGLIVGYMWGPAMVLFYTIPESITQKTSQLGSAITQVIDPLASRLNAQKNKSAMLELMVLPPRLLTVSSLSLAIFFAFFGGSVIRQWMGPQYVEQMTPVLCVLAVARALKMSTGGLQAVLRSMAKLRVIAIAAMLEICITLVFGLTGVWYWGPIGMAYAILIAQFLVGLLFVPAATCKALDLPIRRFYLDVWPPSLAALLPPLCVAFLLDYFWAPGRLLELAVVCGLILVTAGISAFFICVPRNRRSDILVSLTFRSPVKPA